MTENTTVCLLITTTSRGCCSTKWTNITFCTPQLNMAKITESILEGFNEGPLKFPPTYKFDVGTHTYDTRFVQYSSQTQCSTFYFDSLWQAVSVFASFLSVQRRGNLPGRIASSGAFVAQAPPFLPTMQHCSGVSPRGWVGRLKWRSMCTGVTWATPSVTTSLFLLCFHCMWDHISHIFPQIYYKFMVCGVFFKLFILGFF